MEEIKTKYIILYISIFVIVPFFNYLIGQYIDNLLSLSKTPPFPLNLIFGFVIFFFALSIGIKSTRILYKSGHGLPWGGLNKKSRSKKLVTTGPYAYCRNPITIGYSLLPVGMGIMFRSIGMMFLISPIVLTITAAWIKLKEEPSLEKQFGREYLDYKKKVPFIIPRIKQLRNR